MLLPIRIWGDPVLRKKAVAVDKLTPADKKLIADMIETMNAADGAGLAAPQVGVSRRIFVFRIGDETHALINPKIVRREGQRTGDEGCLSIPGVQARVKRAKRVLVTGRDAKGKPVEWELEDSDDTGRAATCVQHEIDHLDGVMYLQRAIPDSISWLIEGVDDEGENTILMKKTTPDAIAAAYKARKFPPDTHVPDVLRERVERKGG
ncbi:MAG: peptide deformylase [Armatimonadetes bacterium]|nr:peptide deformylase [Armatimonadota bacterium]